MTSAGIRKYLSAFVVMVLSAMLVLSGCTKSEAPSGKEGAAAGKTFKVGAILSFTGTFAPLSESIKNGMELYFSSIGYKVGDYKIETKYEDDEANPQTALRKYRSLLDNEKANILVGPISTPVLYALVDQINKDKVVLIDANAAANGIAWEQKSDYIYRTSFSNWMNGSAASPYLAKNVGKKAYTIAPDYPAGKEVIDAFADSFKAAGGEVVSQAWPKLGTADFATYMTQISQIKPDLVYAFLPGSDGIAFLKQFKQFGLQGKIALSGAAEYGDHLITDPAGDAAQGIYAGAFYVTSLDNETNKKFVQAYKQKYNKEPDMFAVDGYDSAQIIAAALKKAGSEKSDDLIKVLKGIEFESPRGHIKIDPKTNNPIQNMYIVRNELSNGVIVQKVLETVKDVTMPDKNPKPAAK